MVHGAWFKAQASWLMSWCPRGRGGPVQDLGCAPLDPRTIQHASSNKHQGINVSRFGVRHEPMNHPACIKQQASRYHQGINVSRFGVRLGWVGGGISCFLVLVGGVSVMSALPPPPQICSRVRSVNKRMLSSPAGRTGVCTKWLH